MAPQPGDKIPSATFNEMTPDGILTLDAEILFKDRKIVVFAVPGAFTPTCSNHHLPGFIEKSDQLREKGVDEIFCISVNDAFVMGAWGKNYPAADKVRLLADGSAVFTRSLGLELDASGLGMGVRSKRYAMIVENGVITWIGIDDIPSKAEKSGVDAVLAKL